MTTQNPFGSKGWTPERLVVSFHGLPKEYFEKGDPYHCHCAKTARLLTEKLGWGEDRVVMAFQSRFGPKEWLQPYADETIRALPGQGVKNVAMISPGFVADCVETLEELAIGLEEEFHAAGGENFAYVPCLNDSPGHVDFLAGVVRRELTGALEEPDALPRMVDAHQGPARRPRGLSIEVDGVPLALDELSETVEIAVVSER